MELGNKQRNSRFILAETAAGCIYYGERLERDEDVQNMLNDGVRLGLGGKQFLSDELYRMSLPC